MFCAGCSTAFWKKDKKTGIYLIRKKDRLPVLLIHKMPFAEKRSGDVLARKAKRIAFLKADEINESRGRKN